MDPATRRHFLSSTSLAYFGVGAFSNDAESQETVCDGSDDKKFAYQSQQLPEPKIVLPTDSLPVPQGPRKRVAAITTTYFKYSHADDIIWSTANSPVILTQGDAVFQNEWLIIEPGVTVEGNGHKIQVFGELQGIGASAAPIFLNNVVICGSQAQQPCRKHRTPSLSHPRGPTA